MRRTAWLFVAAIALCAKPTTAQRALPPYRYVRALSIVLVGRPPTRRTMPPAGIALSDDERAALAAWLIGDEVLPVRHVLDERRR